MSILEELKEDSKWVEFRAYKAEHNQLSRKQLQELDDFIAHKRYLTVDIDRSFLLPEKIIITKLDSSKKRVVYSFNEDETWMLKLLAYLLYRYDDLLCDNCYSFRRQRNARHAFARIMKIRDLDAKYVLKLDIHDYFNSIDADILMSILEEKIPDEDLLKMFSLMLNSDECLYDGQVIHEKRGAMAGVPTASFLANIYLDSLDRLFADKDYFRYSDDLIVFCDSYEDALESRELISRHLEEKHLQVNEKKTMLLEPGEGWRFLGFKYQEGKIDLADATVNKMKGKIRRKARSLYRKKERKGLSYDKTAIMMISHFDRVFYDLSGSNDFTWSRFYFPIITTGDGLHQIDEYMQMYLRYLYSGRHYKGNYVISYEHLKELGYTPLLSEYYHWKEENRLLDEQNSLNYKAWYNDLK